MVVTINDAAVFLLQNGDFHSNYSINRVHFRGKIVKPIQAIVVMGFIFRCVDGVMQSIPSIASYIHFVFKLLQQCGS